MAGGEEAAVVTGPLEQATGEVLVQHVDLVREVAIYTHACPQHPEGYRTATALLIERGEITDQHGNRLSA